MPLHYFRFGHFWRCHWNGSKEACSSITSLTPPVGVSVDKCREENIWEGNLFSKGGGWASGGRSQKREAVEELKLPAQCMLSISQVQGNLIRIKKFSLAVLNNRAPKEAC